MSLVRPKRAAQPIDRADKSAQLYVKCKGMRNRSIKFLGIVFIVLWASHIPLYLFPHPHDLVKGLSAEGEDIYMIMFKEPGPVVRTPTVEMGRQLIRESRISFLKSLLFIAGGILSGILLILRKKSGFILALTLSCFIVVMRTYYLVSSEHWRARLSLVSFKIEFEEFPIRTIFEKTTFLVLLVTIIMLLMPSKEKSSAR